MAHVRRMTVTVAVLLCVAGAAFLSGINWGLPSARVKPYLYGSEKPWSGEEIYFLAGGWGGSGKIGADVDRDPLSRQDEPILLNDSNRERAEIIRRYLLYSYQPDEMITFRALAQMHPGAKGGMDPKLYQYGGLWIYPVGAILKIGMWLHLIASPPPGQPPLIFYLDHPDAFGRFYVAARLYALIWGLIGVWAVWWIASRLTRSELLAAAAAAAYIFLPVIMNGAHEAKPHLPGLVLMLLAIAAAVKYIDARGRKSVWRWALTAGGLCGAAFGMVLSSLAIFLILPVMVWRRFSDSIGRRIAVLGGALGIGALVYLITNPYVPINLLNPNSAGGEALRSNLANSAQMYSASFRGLIDAARLLAMASSPWVVLLGAAGIAALAISTSALSRLFSPSPGAVGEGRGERLSRHHAKPSPNPLPEYRERALSHTPRQSSGPATALASKSKTSPVSAPDLAACGDIAWLVLVPAVAVMIQFVLLAAGKPPEYARFAMLPAIALVLLASWGASAVSTGNLLPRQVLAALIAISALPSGLAYCRAFVRDARPMTSRLAAAAELPATGRIVLESQPAPYNCPPVNLFSRDLVLLPPNSAKEPARFMREGDLLVYPVDVPVPNSENGPRRLPFSQAPGSLDQFTTPITWADKPFALRVAQ